LAIIILAWLAIQTELVQNWLARIATKRLSKQLQTEVSIKHVSIGLFNRLNLEGTLIRDRQKDTLLYAGQLKVRITDWFFVKDNAVLKYVGLEDAVVKLKRTDSVWNYQFIADFFSSPNSSKQKKGGFELNLKKVDLKNVAFLQDDQWVGQRMEGKVGSLTMDAENINFDKGSFVINDVTIDKPYFLLKDMDGLRPDSLANKKAKVDTGLQLNGPGMFLQIANIKITNGTFINDGNRRAPYPYFDGAHLNITKLNANFANLSLHNDTLRSTVDISAKERCGFDLKKLKAQLKITPQIMEFAQLDLQTNKSRIGNYYAMKFKHFNHDFSEYVTNVFMNADFSNTKVNSDDVAFFAPDLATWKKEVALSGRFTGTVSDFDVTRLFAKTDGTSVSGKLSMKGLPDVDKTVINFTEGNLQTTYRDLSIFVPALKDTKEPNLAALGLIIFRGNFNGTINNFTTKGNVSTSLGAINANVSMRFPSKADASYEGVLSTTKFNLGKFLNNTQIGIVDFDGKVTGTSFSAATAKTSLNGVIRHLEFNGYNYSNITTNGTFQKKYFSGELSIDDPNLSFTSNVEVDFSQPQPRFNMLGDIVNSNLKNLGFTNEDLKVTGTLDFNFSGTNIDNFLGEAKFLNATLQRGDASISFDSLNLISNYYRDTIKYLRLATNDFNANIWGDFKILELPNSFQSFLHRYYPAYISAPTSEPPNQKFNVSLNTFYVEPYLQFFDKKLSGFNDARIRGEINTIDDKFGLKVQLPYGKYDQYSLTGAEIIGTGNLDSISLTGNITNIQLSDSFYMPNTELNITASNDHSIVSINTRANTTLNDASLKAEFVTLEDGVRMQFLPSSFVLNDKKWNIEKAGELVIRKNFASAKNVRFTQGFQEINVETETEEDTNASTLNVKLKNVVLGDITSFFVRDPDLEGIVSGDIKLYDFFGNFSAQANLRADQFSMNDDSLGTVDITGNYEKRTGKIAYTFNSPNEKYRLAAKGTYNTKDTTGSPMNNEIVLNNTKLTLVKEYLAGIFSDIEGYANGTIHVTGSPSKPVILGSVKLREAGMRVDYTQVYYKIDSAEVKFEEDGINFGEFGIRDLMNNKGTVKGKLYEQGFKNMEFDFTVTTDKLLLIDTKPKDNQQFYGKAIGRATLTMKGPESNAKLGIVAEANDVSHIFIPNSTSKESGNADYIVFKQYGTELVAERGNKNFNLSVDLDLTANNLVAIDVILDELSGDVIKATGNGRLRIRVDAKDKLDMRGRYYIEQGKYDFNFQSLIRKPFELLPGSGNYIDWSGDPFNAEIHIDAQYTAENVSISELINQSFNTTDNSLKAYRGNVYVIAELRDKLSHPSISFRLDFPEGSPMKSDPNFLKFLSRIEHDDNEMLTQAASLIVFGSFAPYGQGLFGNTGSNYSGAGINSISQAITNEINKQISNFLYKIFKDKSLRFDVGTSVYSSADIFNNGFNASNSKLDRQRVNVKIGKSFFNDKVIVTFGGDLDFNLGASAAQSGNLQWLPDFNMEFVLTKDRRLRAILFNKNTLDMSGNVLGRRNRTGVSISYRKDYEHIFGKKEDPPAPPPPPTPPATTTP